MTNSLDHALRLIHAGADAHPALVAARDAGSLMAVSLITSLADHERNAYDAPRAFEISIHAGDNPALCDAVSTLPSRNAMHEAHVSMATMPHSWQTASSHPCC